MAVSAVPLASEQVAAPLTLTVGVRDAATSAANVALLAGLRIHSVGDRTISLGSATGGDAFLKFRESAVMDAGADRLRRLTVLVETEADLAAAASNAVAQGARLVRALQTSGSCAVHVVGPDGIEVGFEHRWCAVDDEWWTHTPRAFAPLRLTGCRGHGVRATKLGHVVVASPLLGDAPQLLLRGGRVAGLAVHVEPEDLSQAAMLGLQTTWEV